MSATPGPAAEDLGRIVRETWVQWAQEQPNPKPSWLIPWWGLDDGQREVDMRIGLAVAAEVANPTAEDYDNAAEILRLRADRDAWCERAGELLTEAGILRELLNEAGIAEVL